MPGGLLVFRLFAVLHVIGMSLVLSAQLLAKPRLQAFSLQKVSVALEAEPRNVKPNALSPQPEPCASQADKKVREVETNLNPDHPNWGGLGTLGSYFEIMEKNGSQHSILGLCYPQGLNPKSLNP